MTVESTESRVARLESIVESMDGKIDKIALAVQDSNKMNWGAIGVTITGVVAFLSMIGYLSLDPTRQALISMNAKVEKHISQDGHGVALARVNALQKDYEETKTEIKTKTEILLKEMDVQDNQLQGEMKTLTDAMQRQFKERLGDLDKVLQREMRFISESVGLEAKAIQKEQGARLKAIEEKVNKIQEEQARRTQKVYNKESKNK